MNVVLILCHPRKDSLNGAIYEALREGVTAAGVTIGLMLGTGAIYAEGMAQEGMGKGEMGK